MKIINLLLVFIFSAALINAQTVDDVTLVVSGDGATKEEATHVALRSAIEQAYGVFVSANTEILNDELVKDEIATVTSGNVKSYKELSTTILPNGNHMVSLQAVVSTKKLAAYAQSKGASCEFAGATFGANLKLIELNQQNTKKAFDHMVSQLKTFIPYLYERRLNVGNPDVKGNIKFHIDTYPTDALWSFRDIIVSTCNALDMKDEEVQDMRDLNVGIYLHCITFREIKYFLGSWIDLDDPSSSRKYSELESFLEYWRKPDDPSSRILRFDFYSPFPEEEVSDILTVAWNAYYIKDNLDDYYSIIPSKDGIFYDRYGSDYFKSLEYSKTGNLTIDSCFNFDLYTYIRQPKKKKKIASPCLAIRDDICVTMDIERLKKITKFELVALPEKHYKHPENIIFDPDFVKLKEYYKIEDIDDLNVNLDKPIILISEKLRVNSFNLCGLAGEYGDKIYIVEYRIAFQSKWIVEWNKKYEPKLYKAWYNRKNFWDGPELKPLPGVICINNGEIVDYIDFDVDTQNATKVSNLKNFIEKQLQQL